MPAAVAILLCLFAVQGRGTARIGNASGPLMLLWFVVIAVLGIGDILPHPNVPAAVDPRHAITFLAQGGWRALPFWAACSWRSPWARRFMPIWAHRKKSDPDYLVWDRVAGPPALPRAKAR
jgi:hypothetical protein